MFVVERQSKAKRVLLLSLTATVTPEVDRWLGFHNEERIFFPLNRVSINLAINILWLHYELAARLFVCEIIIIYLSDWSFCASLKTLRGDHS